MKFAIYGVSRSGKDYFIDDLVRYFFDNGEQLYHVKGSETLNKMALEIYGVRFSQCDEAKKHSLRNRFVERINEIENEHKHVVVDGHYAFFTEEKALRTVCAESDILCYDKFFYMDSDPKLIVQRMKNSVGSKYNDCLSEAEIKCWQDYEIEHLTDDLLEYNKELHIISYENECALRYVFACVTRDEYNSMVIARSMLEKIRIDNGCVVLTDCDKTLSIEDSTALLPTYDNAHKKVLKDIFKNDRYSNYQMMQAHMFISEIRLFTEASLDYAVERITANRKLIDNLFELHDIPIIGITAGNRDLWNRISRKFGLRISILAHEELLVSKYVKYFVVKELQARGIYVIAIGDSLLDGLMLKQANKSYIVTAKGFRDNIKNFLDSNNSIKQLDYFPICYSDIAHERMVSPIKALAEKDSIAANIAVCKSDSGTTGKKLRAAHFELGQEVAKMIHSDYKNDKFAVIALMRAGLPFSLGIADYFDCPILLCDSNSWAVTERELCDNSRLKDVSFIICDAVINSGKTIKEIVSAMKNRKCIIAANVISDKFDAWTKYPIYVGRISSNSFVGAKQKVIADGKGPDTGDRLYNLI